MAFIKEQNNLTKACVVYVKIREEMRNHSCEHSWCLKIDVGCDVASNLVEKEEKLLNEALRLIELDETV